MYAISIPSMILLVNFISFYAAISIKVTTRTSSIKKSKSKPISIKLENDYH